MSLQNKKILVVGTGVSGIAAAELLKQKGMDVLLFDGNKNLDTEKFYEKNQTLKEVPLILGELTKEQMEELEEERAKIEQERAENAKMLQELRALKEQLEEKVGDGENTAAPNTPSDD